MRNAGTQEKASLGGSWLPRFLIVREFAVPGFRRTTAQIESLRNPRALTAPRRPMTGAGPRKQSGRSGVWIAKLANLIRPMGRWLPKTTRRLVRSLSGLSWNGSAKGTNSPIGSAGDGCAYCANRERTNHPSVSTLVRRSPGVENGSDNR
jgi:hypothetical protein